MKRYGYIIEEAARYENLRSSFDYVLRGTERKTSRTGKMLYEHREQVISDIRRELLDGTWRLGDYHERTIKEGEKWRTIQCIPLVKRIAVNAFMTVVEKKIHPTFIADTAASIKGRGGLYLFYRIRKLMREDDGLRWFYKDDITKFYPSIDQGLMKQMVRHKFKDRLLIGYLDQCIDMLDKGISIGLRSSQALANLLLSVYVDHQVKDSKGIKGYWRYCDDKVLAGHSARELTDGIIVIRKGVADARLSVKPNAQVFCIGSRPLDFLGYRLFSNGKILIRKNTKKRFAKRWRHVRSFRRRTELLGSFYGICKHAHAKHLFKKITGYNMKDFSELGLSYVSMNGKKVFQCDTIRLNDLQNRQFVVEDFETDVKTKQGDGRYVVKVSLNGREYKFFTNSDELKQMLDKAREMKEIPFRCTVKRVSIGDNKYKYSFA